MEGKGVCLVLLPRGGSGRGRWSSCPDGQPLTSDGFERPAVNSTSLSDDTELCSLHTVGANSSVPRNQPTRPLCGAVMSEHVPVLKNQDT